MLKRSIVLLLLGFFVLPHCHAGAYTEHARGEANRQSIAARGVPRQVDELSDKVELIRVYSVSNGRLDNRVYRKADLKGLMRLKVDGYVCGIVVLCQEDMGVDIEGEELSRIKMNPDGTYSVKYFGTIKAEDLELPNPGQAYYKKMKTSTAAESEDMFLCGGYSCFPRIVGNSLFPGDQIVLNFKSSTQVYSINIEQEGSVVVETVSLDSSRESDNITFSYIGDDAGGMRREDADFDARLLAITEGIDYVERAFDINLVEGVVIIDYEEVYNALSCDDEKDIWFYVRTFRDEPLQELRTIAAHETLHVYVDKMQFVTDPAIREVFADLKGYPELSYERFILMITGNSLAGEEEAGNNVFFSFINEKNFIEDMKGGHSQKNLEEFCTSFLHSLIFIERLPANLERSLKIYGAPDGSRLLLPWEKARILDQYVRGIECFLGVLYDGEGVPVNTGRRLGTLLRMSLERAQMVRSQRSWENGST